MNTFTLKIATPEGSFFHDEAAGLYLRGTEGDLAVLAGHTPFATVAQRGVCKVELKDHTVRKGQLEGGLLTVSQNTALLLADGFQWL